MPSTFGRCSDRRVFRLMNNAFEIKRARQSVRRQPSVQRRIDREIDAAPLAKMS